MRRTRAETLYCKAMKARELPKSIRKIMRENDRRFQETLKQAWWNNGGRSHE